MRRLAMVTMVGMAPGLVLAGPVLGGAGPDHSIGVDPPTVEPGGDVTLTFGPCIDGAGFQAFVDLAVTGPGNRIESGERIRGGPKPQKAHKVKKSAKRGTRRVKAKCKHRFGAGADAVESAQVEELPVFFEYADATFEVVVPAPTPQPAPSTTAPAPAPPPTVLGEQTPPPAPAPAPAAAPVRSQPSFTG